QEPMLRIDPGMHTAPILRIGVDAACTLLATGSYDKTVRLWRLPQGKLLRTPPPPIRPRRDRQGYAGGLAPAGGWVAAGGWDAAWSAGKSVYVYIFRPSTGALIARLGPLGQAVTHLAVSPDGRYIAATLAGGEGLRVWERTADGATAWHLV